MKQQIAQILLDTQAVFLSPQQPFQWASGILSPIYCDNRRVLAYPDARREIKNALATLLHEYDFDAVIGTATAGIPMASLLADCLNKPLGYVRSSQKAHGRGQQIEGFNQAKSRVIVIEDLISTGKSVLQAVAALRAAEIEVVAVVAIFSYNLPQAEQAFQNANVTYRTLSDFDHLAELALSQKQLSTQEYQQLKRFQQNPFDWQQEEINQ